MLERPVETEFYTFEGGYLGKQATAAYAHRPHGRGCPQLLPDQQQFLALVGDEHSLPGKQLATEETVYPFAFF